MTLNQSGLATVRSTLEADGYRLEVTEDGGRVGVLIVATPDACEDCLVPKPLMRTMLQDALGVTEQSIDLTYPGEPGPDTPGDTPPDTSRDRSGSPAR